MSKKLHHDSLERELVRLVSRIRRQKALCEHTIGLEQFRNRMQAQRLEHRRQMIKERLRNLELEPDGLWADAKADFQRIADELATGFERWIELLDDARQETQHWR